MYSKGKIYKFEMPNKIFYTGEVVEEDEYSVKVHSIRGEELILSKTEIIQAKSMDSIEGGQR